MKLCVTAFSTLLLMAGMAYADVLERPREDGKSGTIFHEWMSAPPPPPIDDAGDGLTVVDSAPMEIQLLSGPSMLPFTPPRPPPWSLMRWAGRGADERLRPRATLRSDRHGGAPPSPRPEGTL